MTPSNLWHRPAFDGQVAGYMNFYVRTFTEMEMNMNAVERVTFYTCIDTEQYEGRPLDALRPDMMPKRESLLGLISYV